MDFKHQTAPEVFKVLSGIDDSGLDVVLLSALVEWSNHLLAMSDRHQIDSDEAEYLSYALKEWGGNPLDVIVAALYKELRPNN